MPRDVAFQLLGALNLPPSPSALFLPRVGPPCAGLFFAPQELPPKRKRLQSLASLRRASALVTLEPAPSNAGAESVDGGNLVSPRRNNPAPGESMGNGALVSCPPARRAVLPRAGPSRRGVFSVAREGSRLVRAGLLQRHSHRSIAPQWRDCSASLKRGNGCARRSVRQRAPKRPPRPVARRTGRPACFSYFASFAAASARRSR
jgi:hypothetical protein